MVSLSAGLAAGQADGHGEQIQYDPAELIAVRHVRAGVEYVLMSERCRYTGLLDITSKRPRAAVGDRIRFATRAKTLYLVDREGNVYRLRFMLQELMPPPMPPPPPR